ncbi:50S ribosomal protein L4 [Patescibacteria group bacterium]|nr:50S ribosomal protein L4 [Patescibacteria group bacterium]
MNNATIRKVTNTRLKRAPAKGNARKRTTPKKVVVKAEVKAVAPVAIEAKVWSTTGGKATTITLPTEIFSVKWNADLVHQVYVGMRANARPVVANTKFRGEVSGGGKKPWKQKGTGRARHGSNRSPIWRHGGITHGPRAERDFTVKINRKMRVAALMAVLSKKAKDNEIIFVDKLFFSEPKTREAKAMLVSIAAASGTPSLATKRVNAAVIAFAKKDLVAEKSFQNIGSVISEEVRNLNTVDLLDKRYLVIENPTEAFAILKARLSKKSPSV